VIHVEIIEYAALDSLNIALHLDNEINNLLTTLAHEAIFVS
jgi:hypothetical protein